MTDDIQILTEEVLNKGQEATGQCWCLYGTSHNRCLFVDRPSLRSRIFEAEIGELDNEPALLSMVMEAYWSYHEHLQAMRAGYVKANVTRPKKHAGHELGAREFTLTYSPQWCNDDEARELMVKAVNRLRKYYDKELVELECVGEVTKLGCSHIHGYYLLDGGLKMTDKNFKRAYKFWNPKKRLGARGHEGGHHEVVHKESDFKGYIDKCPDAWFKYKYNRDMEHKNGEDIGITETSGADASSQDSGDCV